MQASESQRVLDKDGIYTNSYANKHQEPESGRKLTIPRKETGGKREGSMPPIDTKG